MKTVEFKQLAIRGVEAEKQQLTSAYKARMDYLDNALKLLQPPALQPTQPTSKYGHPLGDEAKSPAKRKRRISAAGRKAISEAQKKRWAKHHKTGKK